MEALTQKAGFSGRDQIEVTYIWEEDKLVLVKAQLKGHLRFLRETQDILREKVHGKTRTEIQATLEGTKFSPLLRELFEGVLGHSTRPYQQEELCHCRVVATHKVIEAIHYGATSVEEIARKTSAGTGCGTCQVDSERLIGHYGRKV